MKFKLYLTTCLLVLGLSCAHAVPAKKGVKRTIKLADGTSVVAELKGDEFASYGRQMMVNVMYRILIPAHLRLQIKHRL